MDQKTVLDLTRRGFIKTLAMGATVYALPAFAVEDEEQEEICTITVQNCAPGAMVAVFPTNGDGQIIQDDMISRGEADAHGNIQFFLSQPGEDLPVIVVARVPRYQSVRMECNINDHGLNLALPLIPDRIAL